jgi:hypothetical protein
VGKGGRGAAVSRDIRPAVPTLWCVVGRAGTAARALAGRTETEAAFAHPTGYFFGSG